MRDKTILAKSTEGSIRLGDSMVDHSVATMNLGVGLIKSIIEKDNPYFYDYVDLVRVATLFHDIGKSGNKFQKKLIKNKEKSKKELDHQVLSWAFLSYRTKMGKSAKYRTALKSILYHHPIDLNDSYTYNASIYELIKNENDVEIFEKIFNELKSYLPPTLVDKIDLIDIGKSDNKEFYHFCELVAEDEKSKIEDTKFFIVRSCLIVADRYISSITNKNNTGLQNILNNDITTINNIINKLLYLDVDFNNVIDKIKSTKNINIDRLNNQLNIVTNDIVNKKTSIVGAAAGFGKTLIGLLWGIYNQKKLIWVCPRNIIAENTYYSLKNELQTFNINNIKVGLYYESEFKNKDHVEGEEDYDIIVTNIDNFLNSIIKNNISKRLYSMVNSYVIFDEYHEFVCDQPLFPQFVQLIQIRHTETQAKTLLLSATPVRLDKRFWNFNGCEKVFYKTYKSHAKDRKHQVFCYDNLTYNHIKVNNDDTCVLLNTVPNTQRVSLNNNDVENVFHTRFPKKILEEKKEKLIKNHDKYADISNRFSTISTRIIGTGLDISYNNLIESVLSPELTIQAIGRIDRMSETINIPKEEFYYLNDSSENIMRDNIYTRDLSYKWFMVLSKFNTKTITLQDYYNLYEDFNNENEPDLIKLYEKLYKSGLKQLRDLKPYRSYPKSRERKNSILTPSTNSYRGLNTSVYVCARKREIYEKNWANNFVCDNIIIPDHVFSNKFNEEYSKEKSDSDPTRKKIIKNQAPNWNKDKNGNKRLCYKGTRPPYSYPEFKEFAIYPETPLVMTKFFYNDKIGLYHEDILK